MKKKISSSLLEDQKLLEKYFREGCVVFMSLGENYCQIIKASSNIEEFTGYKEEEILF
jgi:hypothetical protein